MYASYVSNGPLEGPINRGLQITEPRSMSTP